MSRGERPAGFKVGFTNRTIWQRYQVFAPIWGSVWDTTLQRSDGHGRIALAGLCQPRLEPEIVFGIVSTPPPDPTLQQVFECVDWLAPGFELVQSHCPNWKFSAAETVADSGLHGRMLVGRPLSARSIATDAETLDARLAGMKVDLECDDRQVDSGRGAHVLDGPLHALLYFVHELQRCPGAPSLQPGDVVTTGTWTDAWPVAGGQRWRAAFDAPIGALEVAFDAV
jgi:2-oxo-3-hexenedioate decarboxylase